MWNNARDVGFKSHINKNKNIYKAGISSACLLLILSCLSIFPFIPHIDLANAIPSPVSSESTITMVTGNETARLSISPTDASGVFATSSESESAKFSVSTNNATGYTVSVLGSSSGDLPNTEYSTSLNSIDAITSKSTFQNNTLYNNKWGFRPNKYVKNGMVIDNTSQENYLPAPGVGGTILDITTAANASTPNNYILGLGARANNTTTRGTYVKTFVLVATGNSIPYEIKYGDTVGGSENIPPVTAGSSAATAVAISDTIPTRTGHKFIGWCEGNITHSIENEIGVETSCMGSIHRPGETIDFIDQTSTNNVIELNAMWEPNEYTCTMQYTLQQADGGWGDYVSDMTSKIKYGSTCNYMRVEENYKGSLEGANDSVASASAVMNDTSGITLSLKLYRNTYRLYTSWNPQHITQVYVFSDPLYSENYYFWGQSIHVYADNVYGSEFTEWRQTSGYTSSFDDPYSASAWFTMPMSDARIFANGETKIYMQDLTSNTCQFMATSEDLTVFDRRDNNSYKVRYIDGTCWMVQNLRFSGTSLSSTTSNVASTYTDASPLTISWTDLNSNTPVAYNSYNDAKYHDSGNVTNGYWYNYAGASAMSITGSDNSDEAQYSICPAGWRLPTNSEQASITSYSTAFAPVVGGYYFGGVVRTTEWGHWWSSTASNATGRYYLQYDGSDLTTVANYVRGTGYYVRCVRSS